MARPEYIADLHEAKYELLFSPQEGRAKKLRRYQEALEEAVRQSNLPGPQIEAAVARDFGAWIKQERLPKLPQR
ncbi:MAG: hypothetical protein M3463_09705 [Verrucomicrobiota bacterium]|nr:hypothetical protein [Verrucomicrobiota bacterium]